jgi:cysteine desulfurase family protein (TIGR01976 family)
LQRQVNGKTPIFLDGPGGTQVPQRVIDAVADYLGRCNANHGGVFTTSRESDRILHTAHEAVADFLNAPSAEEIVFGQNMTSLTFQFSRAFAQTLEPGQQILVTRLDHDANVSPWVLAARESGAEVVFVDIHPEDCTLDMDDLRRKMTMRTALVAVTCASNAVGTINDIKTIVEWANDIPAQVFLDAVHYAPHGPIDVQDLGCDFLVCSAYKFFGPHVGILWGDRWLLNHLPAYKVRPAPDTLPDRWMTGTQNHEGLAGVAAAIDYLATLGVGSAYEERFPQLSGRRLRLHANMAAIQAYEATLAQKLLAGLAVRPRFKVWGITQPERVAQRVPTISITDAKLTPLQLAEHLARHEIYVWNGNLYALNLSERLGLEERGGFLRLGLVHYNTVEEVERLLQALPV